MKWGFILKKFFAFLLVIAIVFSFTPCFFTENILSKEIVFEEYTLSNLNTPSQDSQYNDIENNENSIPITIYGDINGDEIIDEIDYILLARCLDGWGINISLSAADLNNDRHVNEDDLNIFKSYFLISNIDAEDSDPETGDSNSKSTKLNNDFFKIGIKIDSEKEPTLFVRNYYYKNMLEDEEDIKLYEEIKQQLLKGKKKVRLKVFGKSEKTSDRLSKIVSFIRLDHPEWFSYPGFAKIVHLPTISILEFEYADHYGSTEEVKNITKEIEEQTKSIVNHAKTLENDYDKTLYLYDYIREQIVYTLKDDDESIFNIDGAILQGEAVCSGYAKAFSFLLNKIGIENIYVEGDTPEERHAWNLAKLDNEWYYFDPTWDDATELEDIAQYAYFAITTEQLLLDHTPDYQMPIASATQNNFFNRNGLIIKNQNAFIVNSAASKSRLLTNGHVVLKFETEELYRYYLDNTELLVGSYVGTYTYASLDIPRVIIISFY